MVNEDKIIRVGGLDRSTKTFLNDFVIGRLDDGKYVWTKKPNYQLPFGLAGAGCVLFHHFVILFGGKHKDGYMDNIQVLDLNEEKEYRERCGLLVDGYVDILDCYVPDEVTKLILEFYLKPMQNGWRTLSHLKCPEKSAYNAVLMGKNVHIFKRSIGQTPGHYCISIEAILLKNVHDQIDKIHQARSTLIEPPDKRNEIDLSDEELQEGNTIPRKEGKRDTKHNCKESKIIFKRHCI